MAQQSGILRIEGTVGGMTFTRTKDGYRVAEKTSLNKSKMNANPRFARTRENMDEFRRGIKGAKLLRDAFPMVTKWAKDRRTSVRLGGIMTKLIKEDKTNLRGKRVITPINLQPLTGFEFNQQAALNSVLIKKPLSMVDRPAGKLAIEVPSFVPFTEVIIPQGASHFKLVGAFAEEDFAEETSETQYDETAVLPLDATPTAAISLVANFSPNSTKPFFLLLGIQFYDQIEGVNYPILNIEVNALKLIEVNVA